MSNLSTLTLGTMIKLWHDSRGHDYVFIGVDTNSSEALFIKANCINQDGNVRSNTTRIHKKLQIDSLGKLKNVRRVTRVLGQKPLNSTQMESFLDAVEEKGQSFVVAKKNKSDYTCLPSFDSRQSTTYLT